MRIIAGNLKGREFRAPRGHTTRPMSGKARSAIFNVLGDIEGLSVFDAFGGSGALAFEAISRGATSAQLIEHDKAAAKAIAENIKLLGIERQAEHKRTNVKAWSNNNDATQFDLVMLDPPYNNLDRGVLQRLSRHCKPGGIVVLSWPGKESAPNFEGLQIERTKNYGDAQLVFYRKVS